MEANAKLVFYNAEESEINTELTCSVTTNHEICISIEDPDVDYHHAHNFICLDKPTAIKLVKHLKSEISKLNILDK